MQKTQDFTKVMQDMTANFPFDTKAFQESFKTSAAFGEKMTKVALEAADKSTEISTAWTKTTISKMGDLSSTKADPADYTKAMTEFASAQAESAAEHMSAFAEVAKKVQMDTVELMLAAGKDMGEEASKNVKKATDEVSKATKAASK